MTWNEGSSHRSAQIPTGFCSRFNSHAGNCLLRAYGADAAPSMRDRCREKTELRWSGPKIALRGKRRPRCVAVDITVLSMRTELPPIYRRFGYVETGIEEFHPSQPLKSGVEYHSIVMSKKL